MNKAYFAVSFLILALLALPGQANTRKKILGINGTAVAAGTPFLSDYTPSSSVSHLEITVAVDAAAVFKINWSGTDLAFNKNVALSAGNAFTFTLGVNEQADYDFLISANATLWCTINEVHDR